MNSTSCPISRPLRRVVAALAAASGLVACASPRVDAQWSDPQMAGTTPLSAKVLVVCEAPEVVLSRLCVDRLSASPAGTRRHGGDRAAGGRAGAGPAP